MITNNYLMAFIMAIPGIIAAVTMHEFTRAALSSFFGDDLPRNSGRLTLNPIKHFEPIGFLIMFYSGGFGWGRPVDTSALYYKNRKRDTLLVAIIPSVINIFLGLIFLTLYLNIPANNQYALALLQGLYYYNVALAVYNVLPVAPMDCVKVLSVVLPANKYFRYMQYEKIIQMIFLFLLFFGFANGIMSGAVSAVINILYNIAAIF